MKPRPRLAVLDMIGTTVAAGPEVEDAFGAALAGADVKLSAEDVAGVRGRSKREAIDALLTVHAPGRVDHERLVEETYARFRTLLGASYEQGAQAVPGARAAIDELSEAGLTVVLTTGLDREIAGRLVAGLGWGAAGIALVTGDDVEHGRPAPDLVFAAMAIVGEGDPDAVLVVGDTTADLEAAARAGAGWIVGVTSGAHARDRLEKCASSAILPSVAELPAWLRGVGAL